MLNRYAQQDCKMIYSEPQEYEKILSESGHPSRITYLAKEVLELRRLLWIMHGHHKQYGDDGEMQCFECLHLYGFVDWKRTPIEKIVSGITTPCTKDGESEQQSDIDQILSGRFT